MESLEVSARSVEEAVKRALEQLGAGRDEVEVTVLKEGRSGLFGLGGEEATVRVTRVAPKPIGTEATAETARQELAKLLERLDVTARISVRVTPVADAEPVVTLDVTDTDLGILIGRRGQTLAALQYILRLIVTHRMGVQVPLLIDVEGYRERRNQALETLARRLAAQVRTGQTPFTLEPMPAYERRIIHLALADDPEVTTESIGEGEARKVVIKLRSQS